MTIELILAEEHQIIRDAVKAVLGSDSEYRVIAEAETGLDAVSLCRKLRPDVVLMAISLPGINGLEAAAEVVQVCPNTKVVILSMHDDPDSVRHAVGCGVHAYVVKHAAATELLEALRAVTQGRSYFSPQVLTHLFQAGTLDNVRAGGPIESLTRREVQVLRLIAAGKVNKEIAHVLNLRVDTVRTYRKKMMRKLGAGNIAALTRLAVRYGLART